MVIQEPKLKNNINLDKSYINYSMLIDDKLPYKFSYLDDWLLKKSKLLINEANDLKINMVAKENNLSINQKNYKKYPRGTIIKADFGIGLGSEMSQIHFAIVLNNYDN